MKKPNPVREAIDDSLSAVRFTAGDAHAVLRAIRRQESPRRAHAARRRRLDLAFSLALLAVIVLPAAFIMLRAQPASFIAGHGPSAPDVIVASASHGVTAADSAAPSPTAAPAPDEASCIAAARACFEQHCDTAVFSFEEYTVSVQSGTSGSGEALINVTLRSIYDNGCTFTVFLSAQSGQVIAFTDPALATTPQAVRTDSPEVQAWFDRYGPDASLWPEDAQAEFARRYEGRARAGGE